MSEGVPQTDPAVGGTADTDLIYFSSASGYTDRFMQKLGLPAARIPLRTQQETLQALRPFVLVLPTYGGESGRTRFRRRGLNSSTTRRTGACCAESSVAATQTSAQPTAWRRRKSQPSARCPFFIDSNSWARPRT